MSDEHNFYIEYHARAFGALWESLDSRMSDLEEKYSASPTDEYEQEENFYMGLFVEAAGSHIQVVSACTLLESLITKEFSQYGQWFKEQGNPTHVRWNQALEEAINPKRVFKSNGELKDKNNFIDGYIQLCEACNISQYLNEEFVGFLKAMLFYRNYVVHNGLEWGRDNINEFKSKVGKDIVSEYFDVASTGGKDWIYTVKRETIIKLRGHVTSMIADLDRMFWESMFNNRLNKPSESDLSNA